MPDERRKFFLRRCLAQATIDRAECNFLFSALISLSPVFPSRQAAVSFISLFDVLVFAGIAPDSARLWRGQRGEEGERGSRDLELFPHCRLQENNLCVLQHESRECVVANYFDSLSLSLLSACLPFYVPSFDKLGGVCVVSTGQIQFVHCYLVGKRKLALFSFLRHLPNFIVPPRSSGERKYLHLIPRHVDPTRRYLVFLGVFIFFLHCCSTTFHFILWCEEREKRGRRGKRKMSRSKSLAAWMREFMSFAFTWGKNADVK